MKRTILLAVTATLSLTSTIAQEKSDTIKSKGSRIALADSSKKNISIITNASKGGDTLIIEKAKFIKIGEKVFSFEELARPEAIALMVPLTWIVANYQYLDNSNGGLSKKQVEELQQPLAQYYQYYMYILQQRQQQAKPKQ